MIMLLLHCHRNLKFPGNPTVEVYAIFKMSPWISLLQSNHWTHNSCTVDPNCIISLGPTSGPRFVFLCTVEACSTCLWWNWGESPEAQREPIPRASKPSTRSPNTNRIHIFSKQPFTLTLKTRKNLQSKNRDKKSKRWYIHLHGKNQHKEELWNTYN